jgi:hypothetical protein
MCDTKLDKLLSNKVLAAQAELEAYFRNLAAHYDRVGASYTWKVQETQIKFAVPEKIEHIQLGDD